MRSMIWNGSDDWTRFECESCHYPRTEARATRGELICHTTTDMEYKNMDNPNHENMEQVALRVSWVSLAVNALLSLAKLLAGIVARSGAMISDAVHSASDVASTVVVMVGIRMASKKADAEHPYGHERMECISSAILAMMLTLIGWEIGVGGVKKIVTGEGVAVPGVVALVAAVVSVVVKELMYHYTMHAAKKVNSGALKADAWHHRSDALSSVGAFIGILFARMGFPIMDAVASIIICLFILKAAFDIFKDNVDKLVDHCADKTTEKNIQEVVGTVPGVARIDDLKTRQFGNMLYVDIEIAADGKLSLTQAHDIAEAVHDKVEAEIPFVKHCMVHVNPQ